MVHNKTRKNIKTVNYDVLRGCPPGYTKETSLTRAPRCVKEVITCPPGMIVRKGYTRKYTTAIREKGYTVKRKTGREYHIKPDTSIMRVASMCVKRKGIGKLSDKKLKKYGYIYKNPTEARHEALKKAIGEYGILTVVRKLDAAMKYTRHLEPSVSSIFKRDRDWAKETQM